MSRIEGKIGKNGGSPVDAEDILAALAGDSQANAERRQDAVSRYLSASDGWREASSVLAGAFAAAAEGLRAKKDR